MLIVVVSRKKKRRKRKEVNSDALVALISEARIEVQMKGARRIMPEKSLKVRFKFERNTSNTGRYKEVAEFDPPLVGFLYVNKQWLGDIGNPKYLEVTIAAKEE